MMNGKRAIVYLLCALMAVSVFLASCGGGQTASKEQSASAQTGTTAQAAPGKTELTDDLPDENFNGKTFGIFAGINGKATLLAFPAEQTGETLNDAYYTRNLAVAERFNVKFVESNEGKGLQIDQLQNAVLSGDTTWDIYQVWDRIAVNAAQKGYLIPYSTIPEIDVTKPYWSNLNDLLTIGGKLYFACGDENPVLLTGLVCLLYNKDMATDLGYKGNELYDLVRNGKWTMERFFTYAQSAIRDVNGDGAYNDNDVFGIATQRNVFFVDFLCNSGARLISKDENDMPYLSVRDSTLYADIYQKLMKYVYDTPGMIVNTSSYKFTNVAYTAESDSLCTPLMFFGDGHALFCGITLSRISTMRTYETIYGILPYPTYEEKDAGAPYLGRTDSLVPYVVPTTNRNVHLAGTMLEALACAGRKTVVPAYYNLVLGGRDTQDPDSVEMLDMMFNNRTVELEIIFFATRKIEALATSNSDTLISTLASYEPTLNTKIDELIAAFKAIQ